MKILDILIQYLEWEVRKQALNRYTAFERQLTYMKEQNDHRSSDIYKKGWNENKLKSIFAFNSFYQIVLGPLSSSALRVSKTGIGGKIPLTYGNSIRFDNDRNNEINQTYDDFMSIMHKSGINVWLLNLSSVNDIVYNIHKDLYHEQ